ncbi:CHAD domain-containing protein [Halomonas cupida]|uniref:CHAD domain-containing protein n=1 Tax=Halomonas cupida TaxID=44933 RepID=UPI0039B36599
MAKPLAERRLGTVLEIVVVELLDEARLAWPRIQDPEDPEGLHDFRVALRRLRSCLKDYFKDYLKGYRGFAGVSLDKGLMRELRDLARSTNAARDSEVMLAWLQDQHELLNGSERAAVAWWCERLVPQVEEEYRRIEFRVAAFPLLDARLREAMKGIRLKARKTPRFGPASADVLERLVTQWCAELDAIKGREDEDALHRPRITGKRLRYLLRAWRGEGEVLVVAESALKSFQEAFGQLHDDLVRCEALRASVQQHVLEETDARLAAAIRDPGARATAPRHLRGFMGLVAHHEQRTEAHLAEVLRLSRGKPRRELEKQLAEVAATMRGSH